MQKTKAYLKRLTSYFGKFPKKFLNQKVKSNTSFNVVAILAMTMHVALSIRYLVYKIQEKKDWTKQQNTTFSIRTYFMERLNSESLFRWESFCVHFSRVAIVVQKYSDREKVLDQIHMRLWVQILLDFELLSLLFSLLFIYILANRIVFHGSLEQVYLHLWGKLEPIYV